MEPLTTILHAIGEVTRLRILALLAKGELTVSELVQIMGQSQPRISRHMKLLTNAGVTERLPEGAWVFYRLAEPGRPARRLADAAIDLIPGDDHTAVRDQDRLERIKRARADAAAQYFAEQAEDWDRIRSLHLNETDVEAAMREALGPGPFGRHLDLGVGTGRILQVFSDRVERAIGVDLSHEMLSLARCNLDAAGLAQCSVRHGDLYALPFPAGYADLVTVHQVLHYLDNPQAAIAEAARVLGPDGVLMIVDFAPHDLEFLRDAHAHRRLGFSDAAIGGWLTANGLRIRSKTALAPPQRDGDADGLTVSIWTAWKAARARRAEVSEPCVSAA
ncbi:MAG: ArsR/SmtB family transcription factor [Maricaulaceae bacterium]